MDEAQHLADRVAILRAGRLVAEGSTRELSDSLGRVATISLRLPVGVTVDELSGADDWKRERRRR
jgi:ABC-2 type transport system ATP-binding protein